MKIFAKICIANIKLFWETWPHIIPWDVPLIFRKYSLLCLCVSVFVCVWVCVCVYYCVYNSKRHWEEQEREGKMLTIGNNFFFCLIVCKSYIDLFLNRSYLGTYIGFPDLAGSEIFLKRKWSWVAIWTVEYFRQL
jgi:hypothetical protein